MFTIDLFLYYLYIMSNSPTVNRESNIPLPVTGSYITLLLLDFLCSCSGILFALRWHLTIPDGFRGVSGLESRSKCLDPGI